MFDVNGADNLVAPVLGIKGYGINAPNEPTKEGYKLVGWYLNGKPFNFSAPLEKDITLTAKWKVDNTKEESEYKLSDN